LNSNSYHKIYMMKKHYLSFVLCFLVLGNVNAQSINLPWATNYDEAMTTASDDRPLLISFAGSDWCKPCIMLTREIFETEEFQSYAQDNLVLVLADFPRLKKNKLSEEQTMANEKLAKMYNQEGSFPLVVLVDKDEKIIGKLGYLPGGPGKFIDKVESLVKK